MWDVCVLTPLENWSELQTPWEFINPKTEWGGGALPHSKHMHCAHLDFCAIYVFVLVCEVGWERWIAWVVRTCRICICLLGGF